MFKLYGRFELSFVKINARIREIQNTSKIYFFAPVFYCDRQRILNIKNSNFYSIWYIEIISVTILPKVIGHSRKNTFRIYLVGIQFFTTDFIGGFDYQKPGQTGVPNA